MTYKQSGTNSANRPVGKSDSKLFFKHTYTSFQRFVEISHLSQMEVSNVPRQNFA